jgi:hypothetical protein
VFLILLTFSLGLAWQYHNASLLPFALAVYAAFDRNSWEQFREAAAAFHRLRVPVIVAIIAFAIYTNDQILEVLAIPFQAEAKSTAPVPLLSLIVTATALWLWARFFSWFEPKTQGRPNASREPEGVRSSLHKPLIALILILLVSMHVIIYFVLERVVAGTVQSSIQNPARYILFSLVCLSFIAWSYLTCIFNKHLPLTSNLPIALERLPYHLQVRTMLLRLLPVAFPCLLAAATLYNVLPRIDPNLAGLKLWLALSTFLVLFGVGFFIDDRFVRLLYWQNVYVRQRLAPRGQRARDIVRRILNRSSYHWHSNAVYFLEFILIVALAILSLLSRFRFGFAVAANLLVNLALSLGFTRFLKTNTQYKFDANLWASYFGPQAVPEDLTAVRLRRGDAQTATPGESAPIEIERDAAEAAPPLFNRPLSHWPVLSRMTDLSGLASILAAAVIFVMHRIWPEALSQHAYLLMAAAIAFSLLPFIPLVAAFIFLIVTVFSPLIFLIAPFIGIHWLSPSTETLLVINIFIVASLGFFALLLLLSHRRPLIGLFFGLIVLLAAFDLNDNHAIQRDPRRIPAAAPPVTAAFDKWVDERLTQWEDARRPGTKTNSKHPVYIIAAEGGGAYAALHAALFLAKAQDEFPAFAGHVFAISGVSGGSIGAAIFTSLLRVQPDKPKEPGWYSVKTRELLSADLLTPVVTATLFHDTFARLVPCLGDTLYLCPTQALDRARAFEQSLEVAWERRYGKAENPFRQTLSQSWSPAAGIPALLLNTTEVETGDRVVLAPFSLNSSVPTLNSLIDRDSALDIRLSTAAGLSARFPGLTAPGWYRIGIEGHSTKRRLVDGGYFENSGVATAFDLLTALDKTLSAQRRRNVQLILISVKLASGERLTSEPPHGFHELLTPLRTLNNTRAARGKLAVAQAQLTLDGAVCGESEDSTTRSAETDPTCFYAKRMRVTMLETDGSRPLPLGWLLSENSKKEIAGSIGSASDCPGTGGKLTVKQRNSCLLRQIGRDLRDGIESQGKAEARAWTIQVIPVQ